jgi:hypothetical protein
MRSGRGDHSRSREKLFATGAREALTIAARKTQHRLVHRFARERDEKGMR